MTEYEINGKEYEVDYDLDNRIIKVDVDNNDVEKYRRLVGLLDLESEANVARRVSSREAAANQYRYDALGRRVIRQEGTTKTALIWWGNSENAEHKHQAGQTVIQNDIMAHPSRLNSVIARAVDGSKFKLEWYHKNYLDHVYAVSDDSGDILEHYRYTAFGEVQIYNASGNQVATTQIDNHILWNTRRRDELTGYYMYKFRHYSAELGRFLSEDPIEEHGGTNHYAFVENDGINRWDKLGLEFKDWGKTVYDVVPDAIPKKGGNKGHADGHVIVNWYGKARLTGENECCVKITNQNTDDPGYFIVEELWYKDGEGNKSSKVDNPFGVTMPNNNRYRTTKNHELHHIYLYHKSYESLQANANPYEQCYENKGCATAAKNLVNAFSDFYYYQARVNNITFDIDSYGTSNPKVGLELKQKNARASAKMAEAEAQIILAQSQLSNCTHDIPYVPSN